MSNRFNIDPTDVAMTDEELEEAMELGAAHQGSVTNRTFYRLFQEIDRLKREQASFEFTPQEKAALTEFVERVPRVAFMKALVAEVEYAYAKHGRRPWNRHEFYATMLEEVDELWDAIKADDAQEEVLKELIQVAAMCLRYVENPDTDRGEHPPIPRRSPQGGRKETEG